jgi:phytoene dehydrogenase-like protein
LTLPGFVSDICSAIHPLGAGSPFFRTLHLGDFGLEWIHPPLALAHPLDDGTAAVLARSIDVTAASLGEDGEAYRRLLSPLVASWDAIADGVLGPLRPGHQVLHPIRSLALARFGLSAIRSARALAESRFRGTRARALFAGLASHSMLPLQQPPSAAFGLVLGTLAHAIGWPFPRGGSQRIADALTACLQSFGGELVTGAPVTSLDDLPPARAVLCDVTPRQLLTMAGERLPAGYRQRLAHYRYGPGVFKLDYALDGPIPWTAEACTRAGTVHLGGTLEEIAASELSVWRGVPPERPFVLVAQQSLFDATRAPLGKQVAWVYCHVPNGSTFDMTERIEAQIERFVPGFRGHILARRITSPADLERYDANYVGGDINGGVQDLRQLFTRPVARPVPYSTPTRGLYICSSSTPPGGGVHGMCGYYAAQAALRDGC